VCCIGNRCGDSDTRDFPSVASSNSHSSQRLIPHMSATQERSTRDQSCVWLLSRISVAFIHPQRKTPHPNLPTQESSCSCSIDDEHKSRSALNTSIHQFTYRYKQRYLNQINCNARKWIKKASKLSFCAVGIFRSVLSLGLALTRIHVRVEGGKKNGRLTYSFIFPANLMTLCEGP
jgi:hypothetical protein